MVSLKFNGVQLSIILLIIMLLVCHGTKIYMNNRGNRFNGNGFHDIPGSANKISYSNYSSFKKGCTNTTKPPTPPDCKPVPECKPVPTCKQTFGLDALSDAELAVIYKVAYENAGMEIMRRELE